MSKLLTLLRKKGVSLPAGPTITSMDVLTDGDNVILGYTNVTVAAFSPSGAVTWNLYESNGRNLIQPAPFPTSGTPGEPGALADMDVSGVSLDINAIVKARAYGVIDPDNSGATTRLGPIFDASAPAGPTVTANTETATGNTTFDYSISPWPASGKVTLSVFVLNDGTPVNSIVVDSANGTFDATPLTGATAYYVNAVVKTSDEANYIGKRGNDTIFSTLYDPPVWEIISVSTTECYFSGLEVGVFYVFYVNGVETQFAVGDGNPGTFPVVLTPGNHTISLYRRVGEGSVVISVESPISFTIPPAIAKPAIVASGADAVSVSWDMGDCDLAEVYLYLDGGLYVSTPEAQAGTSFDFGGLPTGIYTAVVYGHLGVGAAAASEESDPEELLGFSVGADLSAEPFQSIAVGDASFSQGHGLTYLWESTANTPDAGIIDTPTSQTMSIDFSTPAVTDTVTVKVTVTDEFANDGFLQWAVVVLDGQIQSITPI